MSTTEPTSLLAYFAAHAPHQPESWFQPPMDHLPLPVAPEEGFDVKQAKEVEDEVLRNWTIGQPDVPPGARAILNAHAEAIAAWEQEVQRINVEREKYRFFAWRWYYAEQMIKAEPPIEILMD